MKKKLYEDFISNILSKKELTTMDFVMLAIQYSKTQKIDDDDYKRKQTERLLNFARSHPDKAYIILGIINQNLQSKENDIDKLRIDLYNSVLALLNDLSSTLSSNTIIEDVITGYIDKITVKIHEIGKYRGTLNEEDYNYLIGILMDALSRCDTSLGLINEEKDVWSK